MKYKIETYIVEENGNFTNCPPGQAEAVMYWCPGCKTHHLCGVNNRNQKLKPQWSFNGDAENPTLNPSIKATWHKGKCCHHFVRNGKIQFCSDSTHELSGKTVVLEGIK